MLITWTVNLNTNNCVLNLFVIQPVATCGSVGDHGTADVVSVEYNNLILLF